MAEQVKVLIYTEHPFRFWCFPDTGLQRLRERFPQVRFVLVRDEAAVERELRDADVYFGWQFHPQWIEQAPRLRWIHSPAAGVRRLMKPEIVASPIVVTNARGVHAVVIAEHVLGCMIAFFRQFARCWDFQRRHHWGNHDLIASHLGLRELAGHTLLVVGYGALGQAIGRRARAFDLHVWAIRRHPERPAPYAHRVGGPVVLDAWLPEADFVVLTAPYTDETYHWFDRERFRRMKPTAFFINVSRGHLVDEAALVEALNQGWIAGAALDVFHEEPLPADSPLWKMDNVFITPHVAGVVTDRHWDRVIDQFARNLERFLRGQPLENVVDKQRGY